MIKKIIKFDTYLRYFYDLIKVNKASNIKGAISTPIFYRLNEGNIIISFAFDNFYIEMARALSEFKEEYDSIYNEDTLVEKPSFIGWINNRYMDDRGIPEEI